MDLANAFNCVDRACILREIRRHMPGWARWADFCYAAGSKHAAGACEDPF